MKVIDLCICDENKAYSAKPEEIFDGTWKEYYESLCEGAIEEIDFELKDIDKRYFIILDGGEAIRLKCGAILEICWRFGECHIWPMDVEDAENLYRYFE